MNKKIRDMKLMKDSEENKVLFKPFISPKSKVEIVKTLNSRWIGQGPKVDKFEKIISNKLEEGNSVVAVNSGTAALTLAYHMIEKRKNLVLAPLFTCTATNIPLVQLGFKLKFIDINKLSLNANVENYINHLDNCDAVVVVHYGGEIIKNLDKLYYSCKKKDIPLIQDAAHSFGIKYKGKALSSFADFTIYSFQAIKTITTGDGGALVINKKSKYLKKEAKIRRMRWFGIDREEKQKGIWENDIIELGYKFQMTDLAASIGLANLDHLKKIISHRKKLLLAYKKFLPKDKVINISGLQKISQSHGAWLQTIICKNRMSLQKFLYSHNIETNQVHYRNDRYSIFKKFKKNFKNMDEIEDQYICLPLHHEITVKDVKKICNLISIFYEKN